MSPLAALGISFSPQRGRWFPELGWRGPGGGQGPGPVTGLPSLQAPNPGRAQVWREGRPERAGAVNGPLCPRSSSVPTCHLSSPVEGSPFLHTPQKNPIRMSLMRSYPGWLGVASSRPALTHPAPWLGPKMPLRIDLHGSLCCL